MAVRIDGKALAVKVKARAAAAAAELPRRPGLAVVLVGEDPASQVYVRGKEADCAECGIRSFPYRLPAQTTQAELLTLIDRLNRAPEVDGILVQLPLPEPLEEAAVIEAIAPEKDVDCFHPYNVGRLQAGSPVFLPCTPAGVMEMLREYGISPAGKRCVVLGRSNIVGKPMAALMMQKAYPGDATVTVCHSRSRDLIKECQEADIIIAALGQPNFVKAEMVKEGAAVIDVGTTRVPDATKKSGFKLTGDVKFDCTFFYHFSLHKVGLSQSGNDNVGFLTFFYQVFAAAVTYGDGCVSRISLLHHQGSHRLADDIASAEYDTFLARSLNFVTLQ